MTGRTPVEGKTHLVIDAVLKLYMFKRYNLIIGIVNVNTSVKMV